MKIFRTLHQNATFRIRIFLLIITLTLLFSLLIIASTPSSTGYELSIYNAYPAFLWVLISINIFFSIYTIILSCNNQLKDSYYGYFSILLIETIIVVFPLIRGYYSISPGSGDIFFHIGVASQILNSGSVPLADIYPMMHIWLSILHNFLPDFIILTLVFSIVFFILYILSLYILGKTVLGTKNGGIFFSLFGIPLIFSYSHYAFYPFFFASLTFPLILYAYQKLTHNISQKKPFYICILLLSFYIVFCHPMITVFLIIIFSIFAFYELLKRWKILPGQSNNIAIRILIIVSITFLVWLIQFRSLLITLQTIVLELLGQGRHISIVEDQINTVTIAKAPFWLVIDRFTKIYGSISLYFLISSFFLLYITYQYIQNRKINEDDLIFSIQFCIAIFVGIALIVQNFAIGELIRAFTYGLIFATIISGLFFYRIWFSDISEKRLWELITLTTVIITIVCMLTMASIHPTPWIGDSNTALTYEDKDGLNWILEYRNAEIPIVQEMLPYSTFYYEDNSSKSSELKKSKTAKRFQIRKDYPNEIPIHFGYNTNRSIGDTFGYVPARELYMTTTESMKLSPFAVPVERRNILFADTDFISLMNDPSAKLVYSNNEFEVWDLNIKP